MYKEEELLLRIARGDQSAFRELFDVYSNQLYFFTLNITGSHHFTEDIVQDTFLKIWIRRDQLSGITHFRTYLFRMAQNAVYTGFRRRAVEADKLLKSSGDTGQVPQPDELLQEKQIKEVIQQAVDVLPVQQKKVYRLRREEGRSIREIAQLMGISEITVKRHLTEAQKTLRQAIESSFPGDAGIFILLFHLLSQ